MTMDSNETRPPGGPGRSVTGVWLPILALGVLVAAVTFAWNSTRRNQAAPALSAARTVANTTPAPAAEPPDAAAPAVESPPPTAEPRPGRGGADLILPRGTPVTLRLDAAISTKSARVGDRFKARVVAPVLVDGQAAIPRDAVVSGHVILAEQPGKASGRGQLQFAFDAARFDGHTVVLNSRSAVFRSRSGAKRDREIIGGGAAAGGVLGGVLGKSLGNAAKGAVIGGAAGGAVSLMTRGPQLDFAAGTRIRFTLDQAVTVPARTTS